MDVVDVVVATNEGKLRGKIDNDIRGKPYIAFLGIPYAKPPVGNLRFKPPESPEKWSEIRDATKEGNICAQKSMPLLKSESSEILIEGSEDCLFLNVFTHSISTSCPVMVFIHGGGFTGGSSSQEWCGPQILMTEEIVFVTLNYRLGPLGFIKFKDPSLDITGDAGLRDIIEALKWIQNNIINFGGDPNNVTLFGGSAGSAAVHYMVLSPLAEGFFHKVIMQSGCALNAWATGRNDAKEFARKLGCVEEEDDKILKFLQSLDVENIIKAQEEYKASLNVIEMRPFGPSIPYDPVKLIESGQYNHVPMIMGYTSLEGLLIEMMEVIGEKIDTENFVPYFLNLDQEKREQVNTKIKKFYFGHEYYDQSNKNGLYLIYSDNLFVREIQKAAKLHAKTSSQPVYLYRVSVETDLNLTKKVFGIQRPGVCHGDDVSHLLHLSFTPNIEPGSPEDLASQKFVKLWTNFARFSMPTPPGDSFLETKWPPLTRDELNFLEIGQSLKVGVDPDQERMLFWEKIFKESYQ